MGLDQGQKLLSWLGCKAHHDMNRGRANQIHSSKLNAHRAATDVVKRPVRRCHMWKPRGGACISAVLIFHFVLCFSFSLVSSGPRRALSLKISSVRSTTPGCCWQGLTQSHKLSPGRPRPQFPHPAPEVMRSRIATSDWSGRVTTPISAGAAQIRTMTIIIQCEHRKNGSLVRGACPGGHRLLSASAMF